MKKKIIKKILSTTTMSVEKPDLSHMRVARILVVQSLFAYGCIQEVDMDFSWNDKAEKKEREIASKILNECLEHLEEIDEVLYSGNFKWDVGRLTDINKSILRLAIMEIKYGDIKNKKVIINEAIEISKAFGDERDYQFINAFLDKIER